jgi:hypothetical protein
MQKGNITPGQYHVIRKFYTGKSFWKGKLQCEIMNKRGNYIGK